MTENATLVVKQITDQNVEADDAGLRIVRTETDGTTGFALAPAESPEPGDQVVEAGGARVFLDSGAATELDDKVLDADVDPNGGVQFALAEQG